MANYIATVASSLFLVKKDNIEDANRAFSYFKDSFVDDNGEAFIGGYEETISDDLTVLIDKRTKRVISTFDSGYQDKKDCIEENSDLIETFLEQSNIKSEDEYNEDDFEEVSFYEYIQSVLADTDEPNACFIKEAGHEKLRYVCGCGVLITKKSIKWFDLDRMAEQYIKEEHYGKEIEV